MIAEVAEEDIEKRRVGMQGHFEDETRYTRLARVCKLRVGMCVGGKEESLVQG